MVLLLISTIQSKGMVEEGQGSYRKFIYMYQRKSPLYLLFSYVGNMHK